MPRADGGAELRRPTPPSRQGKHSTPIPWPHCRPLGGKGGGSGLLVTEELVQAVRTESAGALIGWFGVSGNTVWLWRKAFGVGQWDTAGSKRLHLQASAAGADATRGKPQRQELIRKRLLTRQAFGACYGNPWKEAAWTREQVALLGTLPDDEVAAWVGRTVNAVRLKRTRSGIPTASDGRRRPRAFVRPGGGG